MTAPRALRLAPRLPALPPADRGRQMNAVEVAREIIGDRVAPKWVLQRMREISWKVGRERLWYENEARAWYEDFVEQQRRRA